MPEGTEKLQRKEFLEDKITEKISVNNNLKMTGFGSLIEFVIKIAKQ